MATAGIEVDLKPLRYAGAGAAALGLAAAGPVLGTPGLGCPLRSLTGVPCPFCGTTRGVTELMHGDLGGALLMNPGSVLLVVAQPLLSGAWCTLCLASAAISVAMIGPAFDEVLATLQYLARTRRAGQPLWRAFIGRPATA